MKSSFRVMEGGRIAEPALAIRQRINYLRRREAEQLKALQALSEEFTRLAFETVTRLYDAPERERFWARFEEFSEVVGRCKRDGATYPGPGFSQWFTALDQDIRKERRQAKKKMRAWG